MIVRLFATLCSCVRQGGRPVLWTLCRLCLRLLDEVVSFRGVEFYDR